MGRSTLLSSVRRYRSRRSLSRIAVITALVVCAALLATALWLTRGTGDRLPPSVQISGVEVGGRTVDEAAALLDAHVELRLTQPVTFAYPGGEYRIDGNDLGLTPDVSSVLEEARDSRGAFSRLKARLGLSDPIKLDVEYRVEPQEIREVVAEIAELVDQRMRPGTIRLIDNRIVTQPAQPGFEVDAQALFELLRLLPDRVEVPVSAVEPSVTDEAIEAARAAAEALTTDPPAVVFRQTRVELPEEAMRRALKFTRVGREVEVTLDAATLTPTLREAFARFERSASDAAIVVEGDAARIVPSKVGRRFAAAATVDAIVAAAGELEVDAIFRNRTPSFTTAKAKELGIKELVGSFTTEYACCPPRVTNIQRAAAILDGTIIDSGETFSLNAELGERTKERGFVEAPMIGEGGKLVDAVGGGVSQIATTLFNTAFFSGLELITHTPHSFYISRYPEGREATVSWGGPELVFRNDWPAAVLMRVFASDTAITVNFYSSKLRRRVETTTSERFDQTPPEVVEEENLELEPGERIVVQTGGSEGFTVAYTRKVYRGDELVRDERWVTGYEPANTIVERGPPKEKEEKEQDDPAVEDGQDTPPAEDPAPDPDGEEGVDPTVGEPVEAAPA